MKTLFLILLSFSLSSAAEEFRYHLMATTGLQQRVLERNGKATTIVFSSKSNQKSLHFLRQLTELEGIHGTSSPENFRGIEFNQAIIISGKLDSKILRTESAPNTAAAEDYQEFVLDDIKVQFPLSRWVEKWGEGYLSTHLETHFSFMTLFPDGVKYKGTEIDFSEYIAETPEDKKTETAKTGKNIATLPGFTVKDLTLPEAIQKLNREIRENHPGKHDLLVAYVAPNNLPDPDKKISVEITNNPPIEVIVQYLTDKSLTHWGKGVSQITIYGWHRPQIAEEEEQPKSEKKR